MATQRAKAKKVLARKWNNQPPESLVKWYEPQRLIERCKQEGKSSEETRQIVLTYCKAEVQKCMDDIIYFANNYICIAGHGASGILPFQAEKYQKELLIALRQDKYSIVNKARQLGVSTALMVFSLWFSMFSPGKRTLVVAHKRESAEEFISKLKLAYEFLPDWLKCACTTYSKSMVEFETKSVIRAITSNPNAARSFSATLFVMDEAAFIEGANEVVKAIMPTIAASDGKIVALSTPNGNSDQNWFYTTCTGAKKGINGWRLHEFPWYVSSVFTKNKNFKQDQIRLDNGNVDKFKQEYELCFPSNTGILTTTGVVDIDKIKTGDLVYSHSGRVRKVLSTMARQYSGPLFKIKSYGSNEDIICTPNHPIRVYNTSTQTYSWVEAQHLTKSHLLVFPKTATNSFSVLSEAMVKLMAWYITEGSTSKNCVCLTLSNKIEELHHVENILKLLPFKYSTRINGTSNEIDINNTKLCDFLIASCGSLAENKRIPFDLIAGHEDLFFHELMLGDGCYFVCPKGNSTKYSYSTVSRSLAYQVQLLAHSLSREYSAGVCKKYATSIFNGKPSVCLPVYSVQINIPNKKAKSHKLKRTKYSIAAIIRDISTIQYDGTVYNFSVQYDESYIANGRAVHNCFEVNLSSIFNDDVLRAFDTSAKILNRIPGGITYEDTLHIWKLADPTSRYIIGVDCASNKSTARDYSAFQIIDSDTYEQVCEYEGKLPTEVFIDILIKTAKHYNNALLVVEENAYSTTLFYLLSTVYNYTNLWYAPNKSEPGFNTNRATRILLLDKLLLFYNNLTYISALHSSRLKSQLENFSAHTVYADGSRKYEATGGHNDDLVIALCLSLIPLDLPSRNESLFSDSLIVDSKDLNRIELSPEYLEYYSGRMGISPSALEQKITLYHSIKQGEYDGTGLEYLDIKHPVEEFERLESAKVFLGTTDTILDDEKAFRVSLYNNSAEKQVFSMDDIFSDEFQSAQRAHQQFIYGRHF